MTRRTWLLTLASLARAASAGAGPLRLIAHRGGVVDGRHPENSAGAAEDAIRRKYWMLEMDLQESLDGRLVVHHDDFQKSFGVPKSPGRMTWDQICQLRASEDGSRPLEFHEYAAVCRGRIRLMIDTKGPSHSVEFYQAMEQVLRRNDLLETAYFIGTGEAKAFFKGKARVAVDRDQLRQAIHAREDAAHLYFLFEHGRTLDESAVELCRSAGVPVVPTINDFHYTNVDPMQGAHADIVRLLRLGVTEFQIDSAFDIWLREAPSRG